MCDLNLWLWDQLARPTEPARCPPHQHSWSYIKTNVVTGSFFARLCHCNSSCSHWLFQCCLFCLCVPGLLYSEEVSATCGRLVDSYYPLYGQKCRLCMLMQRTSQNLSVVLEISLLNKNCVLGMSIVVKRWSYTCSKCWTKCGWSLPR